MKTVGYFLAGITVIIIGIWLAKDINFRPVTQELHKYQSAVVHDVPIPIFTSLPTDFSLTDHNGKEFTMWSFNQKWTFVFFGYTHCPDVCPMALSNLNDVYNNLAKQEDLLLKKFDVNTQFVFITVDPARDTVEHLKGFIPYFNKNFIGLTGRQDVIASLAKPLGVSYLQAQAKNKEGDYFIDHTASFLLLDPLGRLRATFPPPHDPNQIAIDFRYIRGKYSDECCSTKKVNLDSILDFKKEKK